MSPNPVASRVRVGAVAACGAAVMCAGLAHAQGVGQPPNYAWEWATITHPGNAPVSEAQTPGWFTGGPLGDMYARRWSGTVNYEYRISKTEVTSAQYAEFLNAYAQAFNFSNPTSGVTGSWLEWQPNGLGNPATYVVPHGLENVAIDPGLRFAMLMANWLHNDKRTTPESFQTGAYETRTLPTGSSGQWLAVPERLPGAKFWIPSIDEWAKAVFYDPNRYGPGMGGYWNCPNSSDTLPVPGLAINGGETLAGLSMDAGYILQEVGAYPNVRTPWGLLDASGGMSEWTETSEFPGSVSAFGLGSEQYDLFRGYDVVDAVPINGSVNNRNLGLRFASVVPSPGVMPMLAYVLLIQSRRTR